MYRIPFNALKKVNEKRDLLDFIQSHRRLLLTSSDYTRKQSIDLTNSYNIQKRFTPNQKRVLLDIL